MLSLDQLSQMVKEHLGLYDSVEGIVYPSKWSIAESCVGGRGLIAEEDITPGEVLFVDHPLISGPRAVSIETEIHGCTVCCQIDSENCFKCCKCGLLLCSEQCQSDDAHFNDCNIISRWIQKVPTEDFDNRTLPRALTAMRALLLSDEQKQFLRSLQAHMLPQHGTEIRDLNKYFELPDADEELMRLACCVLDANAYEIVTAYGKKEFSRRGLYPVAALMNHNCVPNTRYSYNNDAQMTVRASMHIPVGSEIFTCYSGFLWGTPSRQAQLYKTKHFLCKCDRCADPTERGTLLAALKCFVTECPGSLLPIQPLNTASAWQCLECGLRVPRKNVGAIQSAIGSLLGTIDFGNFESLENFLTTRITKYVPETNQVVVDLQCRLIWGFGEVDGLRYHELSESRLVLKESLCRGTLRTAAALGAGNAQLRGRLLYHLHAALAERARRCPALFEELKPEIESSIEQAYSILQGDISAPPDLELRRRYLGPGADLPPDQRFFILHASNQR